MGDLVSLLTRLRLEEEEEDEAQRVGQGLVQGLQARQRHHVVHPPVGAQVAVQRASNSGAAGSSAERSRAAHPLLNHLPHPFRCLAAAVRCMQGLRIGDRQFGSVNAAWQEIGAVKRACWAATLALSIRTSSEPQPAEVCGECAAHCANP